MKLYDIRTEIEACIDEETGEVLDADKLAELTLERSEILENIACMYKNHKSEAGAIAAEIKTLEERKQRAQDRAESARAFLATQLTSGEKLATSRVSITWIPPRTSVSVADVYSLPEEYLRYKAPEPRKDEISKALKAGMELPGCSLVTGAPSVKIV